MLRDRGPPHGRGAGRGAASKLAEKNEHVVLRRVPKQCLRRVSLRPNAVAWRLAPRAGIDKDRGVLSSWRVRLIEGGQLDMLQVRVRTRLVDHASSCLLPRFLRILPVLGKFDERH